MAMTEPPDDALPTTGDTDTDPEANEADVVEQRAAISEEPTASVSRDPEADPADALEQAQVVGGDDDYPHDGEA